LDVVVLTTSIDGGDESRIVDGVRVRSVPVRNVYSLGERERASALAKSIWHVADTYNPVMGSAVGRVIDEERPDIVHSHVITGFSVAAWAAAKQRNTPIVHTLHDYQLLCVRASLSKDGVACQTRHLECVLASGPRILASRMVDHVVGVSEFVLRRHQMDGAFTSTPSAVIPNPCHAVGHPVEKKKSTGATMRLGFLGRIAPNKGVHILLEAMAALPQDEYTLTVAGQGDARFVDELRRRFTGRNVSFVGFRDPIDFFSDIDALVMPSTFAETFGMSAAEALATGTPVVVSGSGALPELIENGVNGFVTPTGDVEALASALLRLRSLDLDMMAEACRSSVRRLEPSTITGQYRDLYRQVIASRRP
jgi:glycosyltransferase involved in cell wall biosynthesis